MKLIKGDDESDSKAYRVTCDTASCHCIPEPLVFFSSGASAFPYSVRAGYRRLRSPMSLV